MVVVVIVVIVIVQVVLAHALTELDAVMVMVILQVEKGFRVLWLFQQYFLAKLTVGREAGRVVAINRGSLEVMSGRGRLIPCSRTCCSFFFSVVPK